MGRSITFPITAKNIRTNSETGVQIVKRTTRLGVVYVVQAPRIDGGMHQIDERETLASARTLATATVTREREIVAAAYDEATTAAELAAVWAQITTDLIEAGITEQRDEIDAFLTKTLAATKGLIKQGQTDIAEKNMQAMRDFTRDAIANRIAPLKEGDAAVLDRADIVVHADHFSVFPIYKGVDRPRAAGWSVRTMRDAQRLKAAIEAGAAITEATVHTDTEGKTFVHGTGHVLGRRLNADLRRLGF